MFWKIEKNKKSMPFHFVTTANNRPLQYDRWRTPVVLGPVKNSSKTRWFSSTVTSFARPFIVTKQRQKHRTTHRVHIGFYVSSELAVARRRVRFTAASSCACHGVFLIDRPLSFTAVSSLTWFFRLFLYSCPSWTVLVTFGTRPTSFPNRIQTGGTTTVMCL